MRTLVSELKEKIGQQVKLYLTLDVLRDQKHLQFILGHDKSGSIQLVLSKSKVENHEEIGQLLQGSAFIVEGQLIESKQSKFGMEVQVDTLDIISKAEAYPITQDSAIDLRFDYRYVDLHFPKQQLMLKIRNAFLQGCRQFLLKEEFCEFTTPSLIGRASESGSECFSVPYFEKTAYLRQSPQMAKQLLCMTGLDYFEIGSIFRAEGSTSSRHLTEFTGLDVEKSWVFTTKEIMEFEEAMLKAGFAALEPFKEEVLKVYGIELLTKPSVIYMTLDEAKSILKEHAGIHSTKDSDLSDEGERLLHEIVKKDFIFVSDYPIAKRPFYHMWEEEKGTTKSFDLIFRGIEITSGAVRQHNYNKFVEQVKKKNVSLESVKEYSEIFKFSGIPHAGFGIGVERVISRLLGITVKEAAILARDSERLLP